MQQSKPSKPLASHKPRSKNFKSGLVSIIGRPNAGKSTLLNRLLGTRISIVSPKPQTTRERLKGILNEARGQIVFVDTPGIHDAKPGGINAFMMQEVHGAMQSPDAVWYLVDPMSNFKIESPVLEIVKKAGAPVFVLMNKLDRAENPELLNGLADHLREAGVTVEMAMPVSGLKKKGLDIILNQTFSLLSEGEPFFPVEEDAVSDKPIRYFVGESIREQLFLKLGQELPYACAVQVNTYKEEPKIHRIEATIWVERESQKGMVVGAGGLKIKEIGSDARKVIESLVESKVFLGLKVDVYPHWTREKSSLKKMGYNLG